MLFQNHISNAARGCFYYLCSPGKTRPFLSAMAANAIAVSMVLSGLDYSNSCLWGVPSQQLKCLQLVQNTAIKTVTCTRKREHFTTVLKELHWLPVSKHTGCKIMSLTDICYKGAWVLAGTHSVIYSCTILSLIISTAPMDSKCYWKTHSKRKFGFRAFSLTLPSSSGMPNHKESGKQITLWCSADA